MKKAIVLITLLLTTSLTSCELGGTSPPNIATPTATLPATVETTPTPAPPSTTEPAPTDPTTFGYVAAILSQDGFPAPGVRRVRDVEPAASQWRLGGAPADTNHTRIMDLLEPGDQTEVLSNYPPSQQPPGELGPDDFAQIPLLVVE